MKIAEAEGRHCNDLRATLYRTTADLEAMRDEWERMLASFPDHNTATHLKRNVEQVDVLIEQFSIMRANVGNLYTCPQPNSTVTSPADAPISADLDDEEAYIEGVREGMDAIINKI